MAHPELALHDPLYWVTILILVAAVLALAWASWPPRSRLKTTVAIVFAALWLPSGCYALLGTACYVGGSCP